MRYERLGLHGQVVGSVNLGGVLLHYYEGDFVNLASTVNATSSNSVDELGALGHRLA